MKLMKRYITDLLSLALATGLSFWGVYKVYCFFHSTTTTKQKALQLKAAKEYRQHKSITVIINAQQWEIFHQKLKDICLKIIGIDCEWVKKTSKVSILQLATAEGECALIRLSLMNHIPNSLRVLLQDRSILKVGVASVEDGRKIFQDYGVTVNGCVDLRHILKRVRGIYQCERLGLQGLSAAILGIHLDKNPLIRMGNWEAKTLSSEQIEYAALDALVGVDIFCHLVQAKLSGRRSKLNMDDISEYLTDSLFMSTARSLCQGVVDIVYKQSGASKSSDKTSYPIPTGVAKLSQAWKETLGKGGNENQKHKESRAYVVRQRPLYYNCSLLAPDGQMLCTCDVRKVEWYINKGLADKISDDPMVVKLKFEPAGRPETGDDYYLQEKENVCVVCGSVDKLIRKQVIPKEYRRYFPTSLKDHASHDVLLMCVPCHHISMQHDTILRFQLAEECSAPIDMGSSVRVQTDHDLMKIRSAARALMNTKANIPDSRKTELRKVLYDFYGTETFSQELLEEASMIDFKTINEEYFPHGKKVIRFIRKNGGIYNFEKRWRQHFLDTMKPQHLPPMWSVDHKHERTHLYS